MEEIQIKVGLVMVSVVTSRLAVPRAYRGGFVMAMDREA
jgi:hypothetical protein